MYIPRVENHHAEKYIRAAFRDIADISEIEFISKQNEKGQKYNGAIVLINEWKNNEIYLALSESKEYRYNHCPRYHWVLTRHQVVEPVVEPSIREVVEGEDTNNIHIYITRAENHHNEEYIRKAFSKIATISQISFVPKRNEKGQTYNGAVLIVSEWINETSEMYNTLNEGKEYRYNHCAKFYWLMSRHRIEGPPELEVVSEEVVSEEVVSEEVVSEEVVSEEVVSEEVVSEVVVNEVVVNEL
jgi:hypothetical protein